MDFGHSGSLELAMERWLGHCELLAAISSNWLAKGDFLPVSVIERFKVIETAVSSAAASSEAAAGPARGKALSHEDRLAEIGKINDRSKRLAKELVNLKSRSPLHVDVSSYGDSLDRWLIKLRDYNFASDTALHADLKRLQTDYPGGLDHILLEVIFPVRYPIDPPFIRVVYPRFMFHTGHVTWGGSVCLETLVNTGSPTGYSPSYTVETLLCMLLFNLTSDTEGTAIRQGRIDFIREREFDRLDYSLEEGVENFKRVADQHGWLAKATAFRASSSGPAASRPSDWAEVESALIRSETGLSTFK